MKDSVRVEVAGASLELTLQTKTIEAHARLTGEPLEQLKLTLRWLLEGVLADKETRR